MEVIMESTVSGACGDGPSVSTMEQERAYYARQAALDFTLRSIGEADTAAILARASAFAAFLRDG